MSKGSWFLVILLPLVLAGWMWRDTLSPMEIPNHASQFYSAEYIAAPTQAQAAYPSPSETVPVRVLPEVGRNAGLVIGASILVLIIIGGVIFSARKGKH